jgi:histidyl-tRNA synthetase
MEDSMRPPGMRDMLPDDMERFRLIEGAFRSACLGWGYLEVRTPTIERLHLFTAAGTLSPQMLDRVYSFLDWDGWSGERVVLRPDSTIPVARLYTEHLASTSRSAGPEALVEPALSEAKGRAGHEALPTRVAKLFYVQSVLRFSEGGDSREDWQCGAELIGDTCPLGDMELILIACEVLKGLGLTPEIKLSDPGILRAVFAAAGYDPAEQLAVYDRVLSGEATALSKVLERLPNASEAAGQLLAIEGDGPAFLKNLRTVLEPAIPEVTGVVDDLAMIAEVLASIGQTPKIAPALVRNFEYYTGPVFHLFVSGTNVAGGGRYDALIQQVGGEAVPASGFALEMEPLASLIASTESVAPSAVAIDSAGRNGTDMGAVFSLARALRDAGVSVQLFAADDRSANQITASSEEFSLTSENGQARRLTRVEEVVQAVSDAGHD